jgi:hypothetical protein
MVTIKASIEGLTEINKALRIIKYENKKLTTLNSVKTTSYLQEQFDSLFPSIKISKSTLQRLSVRDNIRLDTFQAICDVLHLPSWERIAEPGSVRDEYPLLLDRLVGRDEEKRILTDWVGFSSYRLIILYGLPGIGKKSLVNELLATTLRDIPHIEETFNYEESDNLLLDRLIYRLSPPNCNRHSDQSKWDFFWWCLSLKTQKNLIILKYNGLVDDPKDSYRPGKIYRTCILLITDIKPEEVGSQLPRDIWISLTLRELKPDYRKELLRTKLDNVSDEVIHQLADVNGNPTWLISAAGNIRQYCSENNIHSYLTAHTQELFTSRTLRRILDLNLRKLSDSSWIILRLLVDAEPMSYENIQRNFLEENSSIYAFFDAFKHIQRHALLCEHKEENNNEPLYGLEEIVKPLVRKYSIIEAD